VDAFMEASFISSGQWVFRDDHCAISHVALGVNETDEERLNLTREVKYKDPNMYHEAVLSYREQFNLVPNRGFRQDIAVTVKTYDDLLIWKDLISRWGYTDKTTGKWKARNPLDVKGLLTCFEAKVRENERRKMEGNNGHNQTTSVSTRCRKRIPPRRDSDLQNVRIEPPSQYFRTR
jgi:hypothetical protein